MAELVFYRVKRDETTVLIPERQVRCVFKKDGKFMIQDSDGDECELVPGYDGGDWKSAIVLVRKYC